MRRLLDEVTEVLGRKMASGHIKNNLLKETKSTWVLNLSIFLFILFVIFSNFNFSYSSLSNVTSKYLEDDTRSWFQEVFSIISWKRTLDQLLKPNSVPNWGRCWLAWNFMILVSDEIILSKLRIGDLFLHFGKTLINSKFNLTAILFRGGLFLS